MYERPRADRRSVFREERRENGPSARWPKDPGTEPKLLFGRVLLPPALLLLLFNLYR